MTHTWQDDAACKGKTDLFFPETGVNAAPAKAVCAECPVIDDCREYAVDIKVEFGVWGGLTALELRRFWRKGRKPAERIRRGGSGYQPDRVYAARLAGEPLEPIEGCRGTRSTYVDGCRCPECTTADRLYQRNRRRVPVLKRVVGE